MEKNSILVLKARKGDKVAFNQLVNNNMYLVEHHLKKNNYNKNNKDDIMQDGYLLLVESIKEYLEKDLSQSLNLYLHNKIKEKIKVIIKKYDSNNTEEYDNDDSFDFILATEQKILVEMLAKIIIGTNKFTFMQKNTLLAKLGFIKNKVLSYKELSDAFGCSTNNIFTKYIDSTSKLRKNIANGIKDGGPYKMDLFGYFDTTKEILIDVINKNLNEEEIRLLKTVWKDDFSCFLGLKDIELTRQDVIDYYKVIGKLYNIVINLNIEQEMIKLGLYRARALRK